MQDTLAKARQFLFTHGRLLERRQFEVKFEGAAPESVGRVVKAYQNADGGLGHALEPDIRSPLSQPGFVGFGLAAMADAGCRDAAFALSLCEYLARVADRDGLVPFHTRQALESPVAPHWAMPSGDTFGVKPSVNPTAEICAFLHFQGIEHEWLSRATETCCRLLTNEPPAEAHVLACAARLAEYVPDPAMSANLLDMLAETLPKASFYQPEPMAGYGLTPLNFAPRPDSVSRPLFTQSQLDGHLDVLAGRQQEDGGWPITWEAPNGAAQLEWRGKVTLDAVSVLHAYRA